MLIYDYRIFYKGIAMTLINHSIVINRPPEEVFAFVTDTRNDSKWWKPVIGTEKITPGEITVGTKFRQTSKVLFITINSVLGILEWNPPHSVKYRNESPQLPYNLLYQFVAVEGGTNFILDAELEMKGVLKLLKPIIMQALHGQLKTYFGLLKQVMEQS